MHNLSILSQELGEIPGWQTSIESNKDIDSLLWFKVDAFHLLVDEIINEVMISISNPVRVLALFEEFFFVLLLAGDVFDYLLPL